MVGRCDFKDEKNGITAHYFLGRGGPKNGPKDYLIGEIQHNGKVVSELKGNYLGWLEFDGVRYFDVRSMQNYRPKPMSNDVKCSNSSNSRPRKLASDCIDRADCLAFLDGQVEKAQENKNEMEMLQRHDRKLREEAAKRREKGGPKIVYSYPVAKK